MSDLATLRSLPDLVDEYEAKAAAAETAVATFEAAGSDLKAAATLSGTWGNMSLNVGSVSPDAIRQSLLKSAWRHVYAGLNIDRIASAKDKRLFEAALEKPAPFTLDNIRATFGGYVINPRGNILRGLAEVFCDLDPAYRSHSKVKIGVAGLPKRVILSNVGGYGSWGADRLTNILNALAAYQGLPLADWQETRALLDDGDACLAGKVIPQKYGKPVVTVARGVRLKRFGNGNGHLHFEPETLKDINRALAEYYGDVLPDSDDDRPAKRHASTAVSRDLQFYPTPPEVADRVLADVYIADGAKVLEPSCGDGRLLEALRRKGRFDLFGIEVDPRRAAEARAKGFPVLCANFLETAPVADYDHVVMNPPFYGRHYAQHVEHALKYLRPGGILTAILPATARYDHGLLEGSWSDLPVGSFSASGTNINTTVLTVRG